MALKGVEARKAARLTREKRLALVDELLAKAALAPAPPDVHPKPQDTYLASRLARVRKQIDQLSDMLDEETDPQRLDRLACALARVSEIERQLAGRPMPGSRRPAPEADPSQVTRASRATATPLGAAPATPVTPTPPAPPAPPANSAALEPHPALPAPPQALEL